jgi:hypothetical protein
LWRDEQSDPTSSDEVHPLDGSGAPSLREAKQQALQIGGRQLGLQHLTATVGQL